MLFVSNSQEIFCIVLYLSQKINPIYDNFHFPYSQTDDRMQDSFHLNVFFSHKHFTILFLPNGCQETLFDRSSLTSRLMFITYISVICHSLHLQTNSNNIVYRILPSSKKFRSDTVCQFLLSRKVSNMVILYLIYVLSKKE